MKKKNIRYNRFDKYVLRTPLMPINFLMELTRQADTPDETIQQQFRDPVVREAIFLASPVLYKEIEKWTEGKVEDPKECKKIKLSFLKYLTRMAFRPTPFGLFAGCKLGSITENTRIENSDFSKNKRHTRLDMNFVGALNQSLTANKNIREQLQYYPNSSLYFIGNNIRYVECIYQNTNRSHHLIEIETSDYLNDCLQLAKNGADKAALVKLLAKEDITVEEAAGFVDDLIDNQILVSEMELSVSGEEFIRQTIKTLKRLKDTENLIAILEETAQKIAALDHSIGNDPKEYEALLAILKKFDIPFDEKYIFQTDMILNTSHNTLGEATTAQLQKGIALLNRMTSRMPNLQLQKFIDKFQERYEDREVPLALALDNELGIGYPVNSYKGSLNPLLNKIYIPSGQQTNRQREMKWSEVDSILFGKMRTAQANKEYTIQLQDEDFSSFEPIWDDLPDTISSMTEIVTSGDEQKIVIKTVGGSGAANLFGRFCLGDQELHEYAKTIIEKEEALNSDKLLPEIIHLPENRVGNVLMRPAFRKFEIPYLASSGKTADHQLPIEDLVVSVRDNTVVLRSLKHNKEIIPRLTNAHNYSHNALPIYHFLCDLQAQGKRGGLYFTWGGLRDEYPFLPRVEYENIILSRAKWKITHKEVEKLLAIDAVSEIGTITEWRNERNIPQYAILVEGDNKLLINFENLTSFQMLATAVAKRNVFEIEEFLFFEDAVTRGSKEDYFANEVVFSFYKELN